MGIFTGENPEDREERKKRMREVVQKVSDQLHQEQVNRIFDPNYDAIAEQTGPKHAKPKKKWFKK